MKAVKIFLLGLVILAFPLMMSCGKKVIQSQTKPYAYSDEAAKRPETRVPSKQPSGSSETGFAGQERSGEKEKGIKEESVREEAIPGKAILEQTARKGKEKEMAGGREAVGESKMESIYFDFDQWVIRDDQKDILAKNAEWLKANPKPKIRIEGNCDERGTAEYNLALGQKRAEAAKAFLEGLGVPAQRMQSVSYGLERPFDPGHDETAWTKNRRVDLVPLP